MNFITSNFYEPYNLMNFITSQLYELYELYNLMNYFIFLSNYNQSQVLSFSLVHTKACHQKSLGSSEVF